MKLQNNFTTPSQSQRLLELGLPADSADCYWTIHKPTLTAYGLVPYVRKKELNGKGIICQYPCWSVGRLIEIWHTLMGEHTHILVLDTQEAEQDGGLPEYFVQMFETMKAENTIIDFSKLED